MHDCALCARKASRFQGTGIKLFMAPAPFEIPIRCLIPAGVEGLFLTGPAISATRAANGGARHMATAVPLAQAADSMAVVVCNEADAGHLSPMIKVRSLL